MTAALDHLAEATAVDEINTSADVRPSVRTNAEAGNIYRSSTQQLLWCRSLNDTLLKSHSNKGCPFVRVSTATFILLCYTEDTRTYLHSRPLGSMVKYLNTTIE